MRHRLYDYLVTRDDAKYAERRGTEIYAKRKAVGEKAAERYLTRYRDHIKALKFKMAMHSAIGGYGGISRIPQRADTEEKLHGVIENSIRSNPPEPWISYMVEDPEIAAELTKIKQDEDDLQAVEQQIEKVMVPKVNYRED